MRQTVSNIIVDVESKGIDLGDNKDKIMQY